MFLRLLSKLKFCYVQVLAHLAARWLVTLLTETMERMIRTTGMNHFLLDGFPRSYVNNLLECRRGTL